MIKLNVGACRKVSDNHYGSKGGNVNIELELDSSLTLDSQKLRDHIRKLFDLANASLEEELQGTAEPASVEESHHQRNEPSFNGNGIGAGNAVSVPTVRYASEKQLALIQGLLRKSKIPYQPLLGECKVGSFNELTVQQASRMIESLKSGSAN
jgi:hypothetical protein